MRPSQAVWLIPTMESVRWAFGSGAWQPSRPEWLQAARCVQAEEKERISGFMFANDAKAAMGGRLLIRKLIAEKLKIPWDEIQLQRTEKGKPFLVNSTPNVFPNFNFNISHHGDYTVLAAEPVLQVGIDVMKTDLPGSSSIPEFFRIMNRQFTDHEWNMIKMAGDEWDQLNMFYRYWALKESFIKAIGVGVTFNLQRIEYHVSPLQLREGQVFRETRMFLDEEEEDAWSFEETMLDGRHHVAVALGKQDTDSKDTLQVQVNAREKLPQFTILNFQDLMFSAVPMAPEDPNAWENFHAKQEKPIRQSNAPT
ncbi:L-aminoadipate-semialdehyde dehydrogenase-phosphopantetheinyl transferase [Callorhinchus milii]|nr:L-aminoadipate-semialdehyde dehydrogenase-phosphopantetheinyl transferase [Callorhinchus milii]